MNIKDGVHMINRGSLGKNKKKFKDTHPDYRGQIEIEGKMYWLSGWVKTNKKSGEKFISLDAKEKEPTRPKEVQDGDSQIEQPW